MKPKGCIVLVSVAGLLLALAGISWACTAQPSSYGLSPDTGAPGDEITAIGNGFLNGPVEIRWNSVGGPLLASAFGPNFSVSFKIPDAGPGVHYVLAVQAGGLSRGQAPFTIPTRIPAEEDRGESAEERGEGRSQRSEGNTRGNAEAGVAAGGRQVDGGSDSTGGISGALEASEADRASSRAGSRFAVSAPGQASTASQISNSTERTPSSSSLAAIRSVTQDLWSGFEPGPWASPGSPIGEGANGRVSPYMVMGLVQAAAGLLSILAAGTIIFIRRRETASRAR